MRLGFLCFVGTGHLNPAIALARALAARGHEVTVLHERTARAMVRAAGLHFQALDDGSPSVSDEAASVSHTGTRGFSTAARSVASVEIYRQRALRLLRYGPGAITRSRIEALVIDQADVAGSTVAAILGLPFVSLGITPPVRLSDDVAPTYWGWRHRTGPIALLRNRFANKLVERTLKPLIDTINDQRRFWSLQPLEHVNQTLSERAVISQLPEAFDFPLDARPPNLFYTGPFVDDRGRRAVTFPWSELDGRPVVYASLGTVRNEMRDVFTVVAAACADLRVQLVVSLGGGSIMPEDLGALPGLPIVVHYAPQIELLRKAALTITHGGINTTLESLAAGVPLVAIPLADDQPGVASRVARTGAGCVVPLKRLTPARVRSAVAEVLTNPAYRRAAQQLKTAIQQTEGLGRAADVVEGSLMRL